MTLIAKIRITQENTEITEKASELDQKEFWRDA